MTATGPDGRRGLAAFGLIWLGQAASLLGSGLTEFGLGVWVFQRTGAAADYALIALCISLPQVLVAPLAGAWVDRMDRRRAMLLADCGAAACTAAVLLLAWGGGLEPWHVYAAVLGTSTSAAVQYPAYAALVARLVPERHLGRANGLVELSWSGGMIAAPLLAATLIEAVSLVGVLVVDLATFGVGVGALLLARLPANTTAAPVAGAAPPPFVARVREGWTYVTSRPGLSGLLGYAAVASLGAGAFNALFAPMVLSTEGAGTLGLLASAGGCGMLAGGLVLAAWGGPRRLVHGVLGAGAAFGLALVLVGTLPPGPALAAAVAAYFACQPLINGCEQALWQATVPDALQGRALALRRAVEHGAAMVAYLAAGPLADRLVGPLLAADGALAPTVGAVLGTGPGRGIGLLLVVMGSVVLLVTARAALSRRIRAVEDERPDVAGTPGAAPRLEPAA